MGSPSNCTVTLTTALYLDPLVASCILMVSRSECPSPQHCQSQNRAMEYHWQTVIVMAWAYLAEAWLPKSYWFWAICDTIMYMNLLPHCTGPDLNDLGKFKTFLIESESAAPIMAQLAKPILPHSTLCMSHCLTGIPSFLGAPLVTFDRQFTAWVPLAALSIPTPMMALLVVAVTTQTASCSGIRRLAACQYQPTIGNMDQIIFGRRPRVSRTRDIWLYHRFNLVRSKEGRTIIVQRKCDQVSAMIGGLLGGVKNNVDVEVVNGTGLQIWPKSGHASGTGNGQNWGCILIITIITSNSGFWKREFWVSIGGDGLGECHRWVITGWFGKRQGAGCRVWEGDDGHLTKLAAASWLQRFRIWEWRLGWPDSSTNMIMWPMWWSPWFVVT